MLRRADLGGLITREVSLIYEGGFWVVGEVAVFANAHIYGKVVIDDNTNLCGDAYITQTILERASIGNEVSRWNIFKE